MYHRLLARAFSAIRIIIPPPQDENTSAMLDIVRLIYMYTCVREVKGDLWNERYHRELFREENVRFI